MNENVARNILRDLVALNVRHQRTGRDVTRFSIERDQIVAQQIELGFGHLVNYADFGHPSDVI